MKLYQIKYESYGIKKIVAIIHMLRAMFKYTEEGIYANNIQNVIDRNGKKSKLLN